MIPNISYETKPFVKRKSPINVDILQTSPEQEKPLVEEKSKTLFVPSQTTSEVHRVHPNISF